MKTLALAGALFFVALPASAADSGHIDAYVTPYYDSSGPVIRIGKYSAGLASKNEAAFVATVQQMKRAWRQLSFVELYVAAIRLYDLGYRNEATYWFYAAQYQGRLFALLVDQKKMGGMGSPAFELDHAQNAFLQLVGPTINGYAFGNVDALAAILRKVRTANGSPSNLQSIYPGVAFTATTQWARQNAQLNAGLATLAASVVSEKAQTAEQRSANGTQARFAHLTSRLFPGGL